MPKFHCNGFRPIEAESMSDAARVFAFRAARKTYGSRAEVGTIIMELWCRDDSIAEFSAFIGRTKGSETTGHIVRFTVYRTP